MTRYFQYLIFFVCFSAVSFSQTAPNTQAKPASRPGQKPQLKPKIVKPATRYPKRTNFGITGGMTRSVVYLARNVKENNDATGFNTSLVYGGSRLLRGSVEYTFYRPIDIEPTWYNIKANTIEANVHIIARFRGKKAFFYPIFGISYNVFKGRYTGVNDYLHLGRLYEKDQDVVTRWVGLNVGTGYEYFFRPGSLFLDYKMRVGITEGYNQLNIMDVCISAGLRFNIRVPSFYSIYRGTRSRYLLDTEDDD